MSEIEYIGTELELFAAARNWKRYLRDTIGPHLGGDVLEVGAGIGATTRALSSGRETSWTSLEPDPSLSAALRQAVADLPVAPRVVTGTLSDLPATDRFDAILYIDVLEHIENDREELLRATEHLAPGGAIVVLSPAFGVLFSEFDRAVGHFRRYTRDTLTAVFPPTLRRRRLTYLDSVGFVASLANRALLKQSLPSARQIALWDSVMIPTSRWVDPMLGRWFGRSIIAVYERG